MILLTYWRPISALLFGLAMFALGFFAHPSTKPYPPCATLAKERAGDFEKLKELAEQIRNIALPNVQAEKSLAILEDVKTLLAKTANYIESKI